ncbi:hypothetical protein CSAL01_03120 [Colletotrichum salicis]|uniref:Uncharacterized protein n=1 Tax=Colletotrichum salicis TaxID=1209931 RepID=A0A135UU15_9PEZI|nr:hypothetical protein CSAL01_03120 [Colletotrichum salicis]
MTGGKCPPTTPPALASRDYPWATSGPTSAGTAAVGDHRHAYHRFIGLAAAWTAHNRAQPAPESAASGDWLCLSAARLRRKYSLILPSPSPPHSLHDATLAYASPALSSRIHHGTSFNPGELPATLHRQDPPFILPIISSIAAQEMPLNGRAPRSSGLETEPRSLGFEVAARADKIINDITKRQVSISGGQTTNLTVGVTVGVAILIFILGAGAFLYYYRVSLKKISRRRHRRRRRHHSHKSYSSRSSKSSADDGPASHPPPPAPPSAPRSTAPSATPADPPADAPADAPADPPADTPADPPAEK